MTVAKILFNNRSAKVYALLSALVVLWLGGFFKDEGKIIRVYEAPAVIETVYEKAYLVRLDDGRKARVMRDIEAKLAERVLLKITRYDTQQEKAVVVAKLAPDDTEE
ncbi:hypothetical protein [Agitococcus lubricus]|uniref:Uncharacterized protein n=1 Tax=Agitococcus lubricus TaxID=1077255 RepID=A0A2T5IY94_9GAMM|nr:hypothetical protein [Agitococcus lubricus]PTQ88935.1 hypothetical protein C8N29_11084 [Agitococcus lubricus]